ncbi:MAG: PAS domain S-box protein, partial [Desulfobacterales bacterium]
MKTAHKIILFAAFFGLCVWVIDSVLDYLFFYKGSFFDLLILDAPAHEIYFRLLIVVSYILFGIIISQLFVRRKRAEEALREARDELESRVVQRTAELSESNAHLSREVGARQRVQQALAESEKRYRTVSELTSDFAYAFRVAPGGGLTLEWVTEALNRITGFARDELAARGGWDSIIYLDDLAIVKDQLRVLLSGQAEVVQYRILTSQGDVRWLRDYGRPVWDETQGRVTYIYGAVQDITAQIRTESALKESEQKYRLLVENANEGILVAQDGFLKFINPRLQVLSGYSAEELTSHSFLEFVHPEDRKLAVAHHLRKLENPEIPETYSLRIIDKSGNVRWVENSGVGIQWESRPATLNFLNDVTERVQAEEQLQQNKAMLQAIFDGILDPLLLVGRDMTTKMLNRAAADYFGVAEPLEVIGELCHQVFKGSPAPCEECGAPAVFARGHFVTYERQGLMDPKRYERVVIYPLQEDGANAADAIVHISDITERRLFEKQLIQREKLASLGVLVSSIAHEINNP